MGIGDKTTSVWREPAPPAGPLRSRSTVLPGREEGSCHLPAIFQDTHLPDQESDRRRWERIRQGHFFLSRQGPESPGRQAPRPGRCVLPSQVLPLLATHFSLSLRNAKNDLQKDGNLHAQSSHESRCDGHCHTPSPLLPGADSDSRVHLPRKAMDLGTATGLRFPFPLTLELVSHLCT